MYQDRLLGLFLTSLQPPSQKKIVLRKALQENLFTTPLIKIVEKETEFRKILKMLKKSESWTHCLHNIDKFVIKIRIILIGTTLLNLNICVHVSESEQATMLR